MLTFFNSMDSLKHHFLIAMPPLDDSLFHHSVIYVCEHDDQGAMGLIINRPTAVMLTELFDHLEIKNTASILHTTPVLFGGPVQRSQGMVIHNSDMSWNVSLQLADNVFLSTSTDILEKMGSALGPNKSLLTLGYSDWAAGQLEQEIAENNWLTVSANETILFDTPAKDRWHAAAELLGFNINLMPNITGHA